MLIWNLLASRLDSLCKFSCRCALQSSRPPAPSEIWCSVLQCSRCASPAKIEVCFWERKVAALASRGRRWTLIWDSTSVCRGAWSGACSAVCADLLKFLYASVFFIRKILIDICAYGSKKVNKCISVTTFHF